MYDPDTQQLCQSKKYDTTHELPGDQLTELRWKPRIEVKTPIKQSSGIRFTCPSCCDVRDKIYDCLSFFHVGYWIVLGEMKSVFVGGRIFIRSYCY